VEPTVTFYPINDTLVGFRFQSFRFAADQPSVYLHCRAYSCDTADYRPACDQNCPARRRRRHAPAGAVEYQLVDGGPITVVDEYGGTMTSSARGETRSTSGARIVVVGLSVCCYSAVISTDSN